VSNIIIQLSFYESGYSDVEQYISCQPPKLNWNYYLSCAVLPRTSGYPGNMINFRSYTFSAASTTPKYTLRPRIPQLYPGTTKSDVISRRVEVGLTVGSSEKQVLNFMGYISQ
jgi:hypothetical protein